MNGTRSGGVPLRTGCQGQISGSNLGSATSYLSDLGHLILSQFLFFKIFPGGGYKDSLDNTQSTVSICE